MPNRPVTVNVDFKNVTIQNGVPSGLPVWNVVPTKVKCHNGQNNIIWTLSATNIPTGCTAMFPGVSPIVFNASPVWPGDDPAKQSDGTVTAGDNFQNQAASVEFGYTVNVTLQDGSNYYDFPHDPDVENASGDGK